MEEVLVGLRADEAQELGDHRLIPLVRVGAGFHLLRCQPVLQVLARGRGLHLGRVGNRVDVSHDLPGLQLCQARVLSSLGGLLKLLGDLAGFSGIRLLRGPLGEPTIGQLETGIPVPTAGLFSDRCHGVSSTSHSGRSERPMYTALIAFSNTGQSESHQSVAWVIQ